MDLYIHNLQLQSIFCRHKLLVPLENASSGVKPPLFIFVLGFAVGLRRVGLILRHPATNLHLIVLIVKDIQAQGLHVLLLLLSGFFRHEDGNLLSRHFLHGGRSGNGNFGHHGGGLLSSVSFRLCGVGFGLSLLVHGQQSFIGFGLLHRDGGSRNRGSGSYHRSRLLCGGDGVVDGLLRLRGGGRRVVDGVVGHKGHKNQNSDGHQADNQIPNQLTKRHNVTSTFFFVLIFCVI